MAGELRRGRPARRVHAVRCAVLDRRAWRHAGCSMRGRLRPATTRGARRRAASARSATSADWAADRRALAPAGRASSARLTRAARRRRCSGPMLLAGGVGLAAARRLRGAAAAARGGVRARSACGSGCGSRSPTVREVGALPAPVLRLHRRAHGRAASGSRVVLDLTTSATLLDAYLATTPGGLYAVLAAAFGSGGGHDVRAGACRRCGCSVDRVLLAPVVVRSLVRERSSSAHPRRASARAPWS